MKSLLPFLDASTSAQVVQRCTTYRGQADDISNALGALVFGQLYGWRGVYMTHSRAMIRRYESILGIKFRECMPERTDASQRILGVRIADEVGKFWAVVKGEHYVTGKGYADDVGQADLFRSGDAAT